MHDTPPVPVSPAVADSPTIRPGKPAPVWWLQGVAVLTVLVCGVGVVKVAWDLMTGAAPDPRRGMLSLLFAILVATALVVAVVGCQRRKDHGRLLGLVFIAAIFLGFGRQWLGILAQIRPLELAGESLGGLRAGAGVGAVLLAFTGYWFHAFGFSTSARAWFAASTRR